jgi:predicted DNA-binding helix-hairpin-helix protein
MIKPMGFVKPIENKEDKKKFKHTPKFAPA